MDRPIQVGDLVQIVRWPHKCTPQSGWPRLGTPFVVEAIDTCCCGICGERTGIGAGNGLGRGAPLSWLKRIPPLEELEGQRTEETLREPALQR